jgi:hypothetical protein
MGIPRKIIAGMQKHNNTTPELIEDHERFILPLCARAPQARSEDVRCRATASPSLLTI